MAIVLSSLVGGVLVASLMTSLNVADTTSSTVASSIDTQLISAFLAADAQAAGGIDPSTAEQAVDLGVSTVSDADGWAGCEQSGSLVVRFAWIDRGAPSTDRVVVTYGLSPDGSFVRRACELGATTEAILGHHVDTATVECDPVLSCVGLPDRVTLTLAGGDERAPFDVTLSASLRAELQGAPTTLNSAGCDEKQFAAWIESDAWPAAQANGVSRKAFDRAFSGVKINWKLPDLTPPGEKPKSSS